MPFLGGWVGLGFSNLKVYAVMVENKSNLVYYEHNEWNLIKITIRKKTNKTYQAEESKDYKSDLDI